MDQSGKDYAEMLTVLRAKMDEVMQEMRHMEGCMKAYAAKNMEQATMACESMTKMAESLSCLMAMVAGSHPCSK